MKWFLIAVTACLSATFITGSVRAQGGVALYEGKTVTYIVATAPSGGYDFYGRLISKFMQKSLPGSTFIVQNISGAGGLIGAAALYAAKPDGLTIGTFNTGLIFSQIAKSAGVKFDLSRMSWIGKASTEQKAMVVSVLSPYKSFADIQAATLANPVKVSIGGVGSAAYAETMIIARVFNLNFQVIPGYASGESEMAMRRGEIDANFGGLATYEPFVKSGYGRFVLQSGGKPEGDLPQARDLVATSEGKSLIALIDAQAEIGRFTAGPPGIDAGRLETLRAAYKTAMEDPELQERALTVGRPVEPLYGEEVGRLIREALAQTPEMAAFIAQITKPTEK